MKRRVAGFGTSLPPLWGRDGLGGRGAQKPTVVLADSPPPPSPPHKRGRGGARHPHGLTGGTWGAA